MVLFIMLCNVVLTFEPTVGDITVVQKELWSTLLMFMTLRKVYEFNSLHSAMLTSAKINVY